MISQCLSCVGLTKLDLITAQFDEDSGLGAPWQDVKPHSVHRMGHGAGDQGEGTPIRG